MADVNTIRVTEGAMGKIEEFFSKSNGSGGGSGLRSIRITLYRGGGRDFLELVPGKPEESDITAEAGGLQFAIDSELHRSIGDVTVDFDGGETFKITAERF